MKVVLIGYRGAGKTVVGKMLAEALSIPHIDTDAEVERQAGKSIPAIFREDGEAHFRTLERKVIAWLVDAEGVISAGGGAVMDPGNVAHLRANADVFLLLADPDTVIRRITGSDRPPLTMLPPEEEVKTVMERRRLRYLFSADFCIQTQGETPSGVCRMVRQILLGGTVRKERREEALHYQGFRDLPEEEKRALEIALANPAPATTRLCAVIGHPVSHSRSPTLYNRLFGHFRLHYHYTRIDDVDPERILRFAQEMDLRGLSVTIPHKAAVMPHLHEVSRDAQEIGAVNTIVQCGGKLHGFNTDWIGIREPLSSWRGSRVAVIGAGGAASAAAYACLSLGMEVHILNRTPEKARELAGRLGCESGSLESLAGIAPEIVINATPVGMQGDRNMPIDTKDLREGMTVFDLVYTPPETPLLKAASGRGCRTISGLEMFVQQAAEQFGIFTGIRIGPELVRRYLE